MTHEPTPTPTPTSHTSISRTPHDYPPIRIPLSQPCLSDTERTNVNDTLTCNQLTYGPLCREFESQLAHYFDVPHVVVTSSGTTALHLALVAAGISPGDEVIVPDLTFVATANAVSYIGARPILADVSYHTWCIDPDYVSPLITPRTRAIIPVHLYGVPCDMLPLYRLAAQHNLLIVEDAAEGLGGHYRENVANLSGRLLGSSPLSAAGVFSWYGNKILTTGEGGAVVTHSPTLAARLRHLRGQAMSTDPSRRYCHDEIGFNYRMTELQAGIGLGQLSHLDDLIQRRNSIIDLYVSRLHQHIASHPCADLDSAPWLYTAELPPDISRDGLISHLAMRGIETRPAFFPLHLMPMYHAPGLAYPASSRVSAHAISLPTYPDLPLSSVDEICDVVIDYVETNT